MPDNKIAKPETIEEIKDRILKLGLGFDARYVLERANEELGGPGDTRESTSESYLYKSTTLFEFDKGILLLNAIPELYRVFALEFSKNLQAEYSCVTPGERSMAETLALNFVRILETQRKIKDVQENIKTRYDIQYITVLSKELDRAERHYLASFQALRTLRAPSLEVNIRTQTAVVGQNQIVQANNRLNDHSNL